MSGAERDMFAWWREKRYSVTDLQRSFAEGKAQGLVDCERDLASWRRRAEYAESVTKRICTCPWGPNDGPRLANAPDCPIHSGDALLVAEYAR